METEKKNGEREIIKTTSSGSQAALSVAIIRGGG